MPHSFDFLKKVIDSISEQIVVIDSKGIIVFTNKAWRAFGRDNDLPGRDEWRGVNYLAVCEDAARMGDEFGAKASAGIKAVMSGALSFSFEYPCHSPVEKRWFLMHATGFDHGDLRSLVISHLNITDRKLAEEQALNMSRTDGLTGLFNRRHFDLFLADEWRRCCRLGLPVTLAMIDIDHFKLLNDTYGHQYGDDCLVKTANVLKTCAKRPSDICARYGGDEFAIVFGNSTVEVMRPELERVVKELHQLQVSNATAPTSEYVTLSMGLATEYPAPGSCADVLVEKADALLYKAKQGGRNKMAI